jgi:hypothetical protein
MLLLLLSFTPPKHPSKIFGTGKANPDVGTVNYKNNSKILFCLNFRFILSGM